MDVIATLTVNIKSSGQELKKAWIKTSEIKMDGQGLCSVTADGNKILILTIQAAKHDLLMFCSFHQQQHYTGLGHPLDFTSFLSRFFFSSWPLLLLQSGCFWLRYVHIYLTYRIRQNIRGQKLLWLE